MCSIRWILNICWWDSYKFRNPGKGRKSTSIKDQWVSAGQDQLTCEFTGASSDKCQLTETYMVRACHTPQQPLQNHPSGHLGQWGTPWSAEEMLDGQHQIIDIPAHARSSHNGLLQKTLKRISAESSLMSPRPPIRSMDWTELNWTTCPSLHLPKTVRMLWDLTCLFGAFSWIDREKS